MSEPPLTCVADTSVLVDLHVGGLLEKVLCLPVHLLTVDVIVAELQNPNGEELVQKGLAVRDLNESEVREASRLIAMYRRVSTNDIFALVLAKSMGATLLTGDRHLAQTAREQGVPVHGTLWLLDEMVRLHVVKPLVAADALRRMLARGSRLPRAECRKRFERWGSAFGLEEEE